ncbi:hypothetical protein CJA_2151 [Cellvibrio japonicus Ueda107]|uniref:Uncharacterized protein n=1 Tax=Cellvibrio japonicus (strain Ueda107) TaxID=498211 RepID=B3PIL1_CELJU|nr:hypothetical protein CJA_2151 [Cellvibrio japonicus Ueda107]
MISIKNGDFLSPFFMPAILCKHVSYIFIFSGSGYHWRTAFLRDIEYSLVVLFL